MVQAFEERVKDSRDVTREGRRLFQGEGTLDEAAARLSAELRRRGIPHAFMGGWAVIRYGYKRYTEDLDLLVTLESRKRIHEELVGLGYKPLFAGSGNIRDAQTGVRIDVVGAGGFPGDGKPKPVSFPDPSTLKLVEKDGVSLVPLEALIELKLASGMTGGLGRPLPFTAPARVAPA